MKYKGYLITPVYLTGSDFRVLKNGVVIDRNHTAKDIEYYEIIEKGTGNLQGVEFTVPECKARILEINELVRYL